MNNDELNLQATDAATMSHAHLTMSSGSGTEHHDHHKMMIDDFRRRFYVTLALTIPVMILSPTLQHWIGLSILFNGSTYLLFAFSTAVFVYGGMPFLKGMVEEFKKKATGMMTLIAVAITASYVYSVATVFGLQGMDFFWELCTLILIMLFGHWIEMKSVAGASRELELLVQLMPAEAHLVEGQSTRKVKTETLVEGNTILVKPGERVPADGTILDGESYVNESLLTGEAVPVLRKKDNKVIASSLNGNGSLTVQVAHASNDSYLSRVVKLVEDAQKTKSSTQLLADKAARVLTIVALASGLLTFTYWWLIANETIVFAVERMVTVIVICCPHALGLAVPLVVAISTSLAAKRGLLIKNRSAFENTRRITTMFFDKTGTLTMGKFLVARVVSLGTEFSENDIICLASAVEQNSEHPISRGIVDRAKELSITIPQVAAFEAIPGKGVQGSVESKLVRVMSPRFLTELGIALPAGLQENTIETVVFVVIEEVLRGYIALSDKIRPESQQAIKALQENGIKCFLLTGDKQGVAQSVSNELKLDGFFAEVLPEKKLQKIKDLQQSGEFVAMAGDGVNDAPALAQADVGIAVGSGSDIAAETAGIILVNSNPKDIASLILFEKATYRKMLQNLVWATGYNVIALPLAAGVLIKWGIVLSPAAGAVLMSLSTIVVAVNAQLLRRNWVKD